MVQAPGKHEQLPRAPAGGGEAEQEGSPWRQNGTAAAPQGERHGVRGQGHQATWPLAAGTCHCPQDSEGAKGPGRVLG